jgi:5'-3' exonuclease
MGVKGLLQKLGDGLQRRNIFVDCRGQTVGIDGNVWFYELGRRHLGDWRHARWEPIVAAFIERAAFLLASGITPVFVFDGAPVPAKKEEHERRAARRAQATEKFLKEVVGDENESGVQLRP